MARKSTRKGTKKGGWWGRRPSAPKQGMPIISQGYMTSTGVWVPATVKWQGGSRRRTKKRVGGNPRIAKLKAEDEARKQQFMRYQQDMAATRPT